MNMIPKKRKLNRKYKIKELMGVYPGLLTGREKQVLDMYINPQVNGSDIARELKISRQAVHDHIKRALERMESCEDTVNFLKRRDGRRKDIKKLTNLINTVYVKSPSLKEEIEEMKRIIKHIKKND